MKSFRFGREGRASSDAVMKKPNLLRRFAHKAKKIFHSDHTSSSGPTSTATRPPAQLQEAAAQASSSLNEGPVLEPAEWLKSAILPNQVVASRNIKTTSQRSRLPKHIQRTLEGASSVYSQAADNNVGFFPPQPKIAKLSAPDCTSTTRIATAESSGVVSATTNHLTAPEEDGKHQLHARCQQSVDVGNRSFFVVPPNARDQHQRVSLPPATPLTDGAEDYSDLFTVLFETAAENHPDCEDRQPTCPADIHSNPIPEFFFSAQSCKEVEMIRRQRLIFAARLEAELDIQKASLEADFEKCYDTSDRLHEIDILNLKDDHEAELKDVQEERDAALAEIKALTVQNNKLDLDVKHLTAHVGGLEQLVGQRTEERDCLRCQVDLSAKDNHDLFSEVGRLRQAEQTNSAAHEAMAQLEELRATHYETLCMLDMVRTERDGLQNQNADLERRGQDVYAAYQAKREEKDVIQRQLVEFVEEKGKDFSWHVRENIIHLELQSADHEQAESNATAMARELHRREAQKVLSLRAQIAELSSTKEAELKQQARAIEELSEEASFNATALEASLAEQSQLVKTHKEMLNALSCDRDMSELTRGLAHDLQKAFEERALFSLAFMQAEQKIVKSEQRRRAHVCDLKDMVRDKEDELSVLRAKLEEADSKVSGQEFALEARDDEIRNKVPELRERINELEGIMEQHAMAPSQHHTRVIMDLQNRLEKSAQMAAFYEHNMVKALFQFDNIQTEWSFTLGGVIDDVQMARGFRDQRDALNIECRALRERFADELLIQPLVVPEGMMTKSEIEEEQLRNMDEGVLKQFLMTYKALPKWLVEPGCPGYEQLRIDTMLPELERQQKEREAIHQSFGAEGQNQDGDQNAKVAGQEDDEEEDCTF